MSNYVSEKLDITYSIPSGLIYMLCGVTDKQRKEVWCELSDVANICANRLFKKTNQYHSWTAKKFPGTDIELRIDMRKQTNWKTKKQTFSCHFKLGKTAYETFTQEQVNTYITESILLGADEQDGNNS